MKKTTWLTDPNRTFADGIALYNTMKKSTKFDMFFNNNPNAKQGDAAFNILEQELKRITRIAGQNVIAAIENAKPSIIAVKPIVKKGAAPAEIVAPIGKEKPKFFTAKMYDLNILPEKLQVKFLENQDLTKIISAKHEKMKLLAKDPNKNKIGLEEERISLEKLEDARNKNWEAIDLWWNTERNKPAAPKTDSEKAIELSNEIIAAKKYLDRYSKSTGEVQINKCKERLAFLKKHNIKWQLKKN